MDNINKLFHLQIVSPFSFILPVGISFYTFQALSYTMDVYRDKISAEKSFLKYALFVSFFPQLVAGPIERSEDLLPQIKDTDKHKFDFDNIRDGLCLILYGFFLKIVMADRIAIIVDHTFDSYPMYGFIRLFIAAALFPIQILCDFNGYSVIAKGSAKMLGITLMDNFRQPYLATSIREFWRRWHISLTSWFTDYLYIPLGGNRKGFFRQMFNTMIVFLVSGLWHGANWSYVVWGMIHGIYLVAGSIKFKFIYNLKQKFNLPDKPMKFSTRLLKVFFVYILTMFAWVFFRATDCKMALAYLHHMFTSFLAEPLLTIDGFERINYTIILFSILIMLIVDIIHEKNIKIRQWLYQENLWFRWMIYLAAFWGILLLGIYGVEYDASQFIYFQF